MNCGMNMGNHKFSCTYRFFPLPTAFEYLHLSDTKKERCEYRDPEGLPHPAQARHSTAQMSVPSALVRGKCGSFLDRKHYSVKEN